MRSLTLIAGALAACVALPALADGPLDPLLGGMKPPDSKPADPPAQAPAPDGTKVYFIEPGDGIEVSSPVRVIFGLSGMGVAPAGVDTPNTGHHHLLIDDPKVDMKSPLPATDQIKHYGGGQTEAEVNLAPGKHTLQLLLGDSGHTPHNPAVLSDKITITVRDPRK